MSPVEWFAGVVMVVVVWLAYMTIINDCRKFTNLININKILHTGIDRDIQLYYNRRLSNQSSLSKTHLSFSGIGSINYSIDYMIRNHETVL